MTEREIEGPDSWEVAPSELLVLKDRLLQLGIDLHAKWRPKEFFDTLFSPSDNRVQILKLILKKCYPQEDFWNFNGDTNETLQRCYIAVKQMGLRISDYTLYGNGTLEESLDFWTKLLDYADSNGMIPERKESWETASFTELPDIDGEHVGLDEDGKFFILEGMDRSLNNSDRDLTALSRYNAKQLTDEATQAGIASSDWLSRLEKLLIHFFLIIFDSSSDSTKIMLELMPKEAAGQIEDIFKLLLEAEPEMYENLAHIVGMAERWLVHWSGDDRNKALEFVKLYMIGIKDKNYYKQPVQVRLKLLGSFISDLKHMEETAMLFALKRKSSDKTLELPANKNLATLKFIKTPSVPEIKPPSPRVKPAAHFARVVASILCDKPCFKGIKPLGVYADGYTKQAFEDPLHNDERFNKYIDKLYGSQYQKTDVFKKDVAPIIKAPPRPHSAHVHRDITESVENTECWLPIYRKSYMEYIRDHPNACRERMSASQKQKDNNDRRPQRRASTTSSTHSVYRLETRSPDPSRERGNKQIGQNLRTENGRQKNPYEDYSRTNNRDFREKTDYNRQNKNPYDSYPRNNGDYRDKADYNRQKNPYDGYPRNNGDYRDKTYYNHQNNPYDGYPRNNTGDYRDKTDYNRQKNPYEGYPRNNNGDYNRDKPDYNRQKNPYEGYPRNNGVYRERTENNRQKNPFEGYPRNNGDYRESKYNRQENRYEDDGNYGRERNAGNRGDNGYETKPRTNDGDYRGRKQSNGSEHRDGYDTNFRANNGDDGRDRRQSHRTDNINRSKSINNNDDDYERERKRQSNRTDGSKSLNNNDDDYGRERRRQSNRVEGSKSLNSNDGDYGRNRTRQSNRTDGSKSFNNYEGDYGREKRQSNRTDGSKSFNNNDGDGGREGKQSNRTDGDKSFDNNDGDDGRERRRQSNQADNGHGSKSLNNDDEDHRRESSDRTGNSFETKASNNPNNGNSRRKNKPNNGQHPNNPFDTKACNINNGDNRSKSKPIKSGPAKPWNNRTPYQTNTRTINWGDYQKKITKQLKQGACDGNLWNNRNQYETKPLNLNSNGNGDYSRKIQQINGPKNPWKNRNPYETRAPIKHDDFRIKSKSSIQTNRHEHPWCIRHAYESQTRINNDGDFRRNVNIETRGYGQNCNYLRKDLPRILANGTTTNSNKGRIYNSYEEWRHEVNDNCIRRATTARKPGHYARPTDYYYPDYKSDDEWVHNQNGQRMARKLTNSRRPISEAQGDNELKLPTLAIRERMPDDQMLQQHKALPPPLKLPCVCMMEVHGFTHPVKLPCVRMMEVNRFTDI